VIWPAFLAVSAGFWFAAASILLKRGLRYASPQTAVVFSVTFTAAFVWVAAAFTSPLSRLFTPRIVPFLVAGLVAPGLARLVYYTGIDRIGVSRATALASTQPLFAVTMAIAFLGERPTWVLVLGAGGVVAGSVLLSRRDQVEQPWRRRDMIFPLVAAVGFGLRDNLSRYGFQSFDDPMLGAAAATLSSVAVMWIVAARSGSKGLYAARQGIGFLGMAGLCEGCASLMMWQALARGRVSIVSPLVHAQPFFTIVLATLFLRDLERVTWRIVLASGLIVTGVVLVIRFR
jgi:drug/metabolite transporter, DME family